MTKPPELELPLRITVRHPPAGVTFAMQCGRHELLEPSERSGGRLVFDFSVRVRTNDGGTAPNFLGPFTQGPPSARFVYVNSGQHAGQPASPWDRRAKIPLAGVTTAMIDAVARTPHTRIETAFDGTSRDGGPTCATVKGIVWRLVTADSVAD